MVYPFTPFKISQLHSDWMLFVNNRFEGGWVSCAYRANNDKNNNDNDNNNQSGRSI